MRGANATPTPNPTLNPSPNPSQVSDEGDLLYSFPELMLTAAEPAAPPLPPGLEGSEVGLRRGGAGSAEGGEALTSGVASAKAAMVCGATLTLTITLTLTLNLTLTLTAHPHLYPSPSPLSPHPLRCPPTPHPSPLARCGRRHRQAGCPSQATP